jgi:hypothetical protein
VTVGSSVESDSRIVTSSKGLVGMDAQLSEAIAASIGNLEQWTPESIMFPYACVGFDADGNDVVGTVNLMDYIGKNAPRANELLFFARLPEWSDGRDDASRGSLNVALMKACHDAGFGIACSGWNQKQGRNPYYCCRRFLYKEQKTAQDVSKQRNVQSRKPKTSEERCTFRFHVNWDDGYSRWVMIGGIGCGEHAKHVKMSREEVYLSSKVLSAEAKKVASDMLDTNIEPSAVQSVLEKQTSVALTAGQVAYLRNQGQRPESMDQEEALTPAQRIINDLLRNPKVSMVLLTDAGGVDSQLLTIKKQSARERAESARERAATSTSADDGNVDTGTSLLDPVPTTLPNDSAAAAQAYAKNVRESLRVGNGSVLLAIAWMTEEELRIVSMYPEVLASDVTEQTNKEKRSLVMLAGLTSEMKSFTACRAFLPSCCSWVFD